MDIENIIQQTKVRTEERVKFITPLVHNIILCEIKMEYVNSQAKNELKQWQKYNMDTISEMLLNPHLRYKIKP